MGRARWQGFLAVILPLCLDLKGLGESSLLSLPAWAARADMKGSVELGEPQAKFLNDVGTAWRGQEFQHLRIIGEPGIGKTRLVLEAASTPDLGSCVIYIPHAEEFQRSMLFDRAYLKPDRDYTAHLVIDECEEQDRASIWGALKGKPHIKLITIDHGPETSTDSSMEVFQCPPLGKDQITAILSSYIGKRMDVSNWAEWCEGSPRVAHDVGDNLKRNPKDILKSPASVPIWDRFVLGHKRLDSKSASEHFTVLRHLALFQRFGFEDPVSEEAQFISRLVVEADPNITWARFQSIVRHHQARRILQGRHTLFIVPKALHIYLWVQFWNEYGLGFSFQKFMERLPAGLKHWFLRLFIYAHASSVAQAAVKKILAPSTGPFAERAFLESELGTRLLSYLAEADPPATLHLLEETFGQWSLDELRAWTTGRQDIVWALEKIAVWRDLFPRAAAVLTRMALTENSKFSNNSKGTLTGLFGVGLGWAPAQEAPPGGTHFPTIEKLLRSPVAAERTLGLGLCQEWLLPTAARVWWALSTKECGRPWNSGTRSFTTNCSMPGDACGSSSVRRNTEHWSDDDKRAGASVLIEAGVSLVRYVAVAKEVMDTLFELADETAVDRSQFVAAVVTSLRHPLSKYPKGIRNRLKALDKKLTGFSFWDRFSRFVLYTTWDEDHSIKGDVVTDDPLTKRRVEKLAAETVRDHGLFVEHVSRFVSSEGHRLAEFGYEVEKP